MHDTAHTIGGLFLNTYAKASCKIVELGALNVNGTLRDFRPEAATYIGLDAEVGPGVDVVVKPGAPLPLASNSADVVVSSSMLEHDSFFWETFLEMVRIAKPDGALYINAPSNGWYHRYPVDNWRFYPDSGKALESWARRNGYPLTLLESFIAERKGDIWNDFVAVFVKGLAPQEAKSRFLSNRISCTNIWYFDQATVSSEREASEDMVLTQRLRERAEALERSSSDEIRHLRAGMEELARALSENTLLIQHLRSRIEELQQGKGTAPSPPFARMFHWLRRGRHI
jgi:SAM-dependent methyltransferase